MALRLARRIIWEICRINAANGFLNPDPSLESPRSRYLSQDSVGSALRFRSSAYGRYAVGTVLDQSQQNLGLARDRGNSNDGSGLNFCE